VKQAVPALQEGAMRLRDQTDAPSDARGDRVLDFHPGIAMRWQITRSTADTGGELLETVIWVGPRTGGPPLHTHPSADESYEVIEGTLEVCIDGGWRTLGAGESASVPAGTPHTFKNASPRPVRLVNIHLPALRFEAMFRELHALVQARKIKRLPPTDPLSMIYAAMWFAKYSDEQRMTKPPDAVFKALARLGRAFGLRLEAGVQA
jgi:quercetin dioxygenase-like cupin family protein